jgi:hypothetical protein
MGARGRPARETFIASSPRARRPRSQVFFRKTLNLDVCSFMMYCERFLDGGYDVCVGDCPDAHTRDEYASGDML